MNICPQTFGHAVYYECNMNEYLGFIHVSPEFVVSVSGSSVWHNAAIQHLSLLYVRKRIQWNLKENMWHIYSKSGTHNLMKRFSQIKSAVDNNNCQIIWCRNLRLPCTWFQAVATKYKLLQNAPIRQHGVGGDMKTCWAICSWQSFVIVKDFTW